MLVTVALLVIFLVHLAAFAVLGSRRRQLYYAALVVTFGLLSGAMAARLFPGELAVVDGIGLAMLLRYGAWGAAAVSISWTLLRIRARRAQRRAATE